MPNVSQISPQAETFFFIDAFGVGLSGFILSIFIYYSLKQTKLASTDYNHVKYYGWSIKCAKISVITAMLMFLWKMLFLNDLIIPWNFINNAMATINDAFFGAMFLIQKLTFLYSFSFHIQSLLSVDKIPGAVKFWLILSGLICIVSGLAMIITDLVIATYKEIGTSDGTNYITMYLGFEDDENDENDTLTILTTLFFIIVFVYNMLILWYYIFGLRDVQNDISTQRVKGAVVISISLLVYFLDSLEQFYVSDFEYLFDNVIVIVDILCLLLLYKSAVGQKIYDISCGLLCDSCCKKLIFKSNNGSGGNELIPLQQDADVIDDVTDVTD